MNAIDDSMAPLFEKAEREGLWFFTPYQHLWFSPEELRAEQANGRFRWGAVNWKLLPPSEFLAEKQRSVNVAEEDLDAARKRVEGSQR